ncbi:unnamed protein product [Amoebophrya sp. A120]|nr:unnamed protein product [Amoebophrya sp. A120]|eukprot:GSA120T00016407001.1
MIDLFLLFFAIAGIFSFFVINAKMVFYYEDSDEASKDHIGLRFVVIASFTIAYIVIFLLPIDVRNARNNGGLNMEAFWLIAFISVILLILLVLPMGIFWLEINGDWKIVFGNSSSSSAGGGAAATSNANTTSRLAQFRNSSPGRKLLVNMLFFFFIVFMFLLISFAFLAVAKLPVQDYPCGNWISASEQIRSGHVCAISAEKFLEINVRFDIYLMAVFCFLGWWLFVVFGGVGLTALPMDLLIEYQDRPKPITASQYASRKILYAQTAESLLAKAQELQDRETELKDATGGYFSNVNKRKRELKTEFNKFKQSCFLLEKEYDHMEICMKQRGENPVTSGLKVFFGVIFAIISFFWVLHIFFYLLIDQPGEENEEPVSLMLNEFLQAFESSGLFVLAAVFFAILNMHLVFATVTGCLKVGMRAFCLFSIHPMKKGHTPLNSLLFNAILVNFTSCAIVQFAQLAFRDYARATTADVVFNAQIRYLKFYRAFFENDVFVIMLLCWCLLSFAYLLMYPRDKPALKLGDEKSTSQFLQIVGKGQEEKDNINGSKNNSRTGSKNSV